MRDDEGLITPASIFDLRESYTEIRKQIMFTFWLFGTCLISDFAPC